MRKEIVLRVALDVLVIAVLVFGWIVWTRSYNGQVAYEYVVTHPSVQPFK